MGDEPLVIDGSKSAILEMPAFKPISVEGTYATSCIGVDDQGSLWQPCAAAISANSAVVIAENAIPINWLNPEDPLSEADIVRVTDIKVKKIEVKGIAVLQTNEYEDNELRLRCREHVPESSSEPDLQIKLAQMRIDHIRATASLCAWPNRVDKSNCISMDQTVELHNVLADSWTSIEYDWDTMNHTIKSANFVDAKMRSEFVGPNYMSAEIYQASLAATADYLGEVMVKTILDH